MERVFASETVNFTSQSGQTNDYKLINSFPETWHSALKEQCEASSPPSFVLFSRALEKVAAWLEGDNSAIFLLILTEVAW